MNQKEFDDIGYKWVAIYDLIISDWPSLIRSSFMIGGDGHIYEGVGWHKRGAHTKDWNKKSIGIGFVGNFTSKYFSEIIELKFIYFSYWILGEAPSKKQLKAGKKLIRCAVALAELEDDYKLLGARSLRATNSPGDALFKEIQSWKGFVRSP